MAEDTEIDYDLDPSDVPAPVKAEKTETPAPAPKAEKPAPKHKSFFLRAAAKAGISEEEANEMEPDELERAIRLATPASVSVASPAPQPAQKPAGDGDEDDDADDFADLEGYDEVFVKRFKKLHDKVKGLKETAKTIKQIEEREQKRAELEFTRKIDKLFAKSGVPALGDKSFEDYDPNSPEMLARRQVWAAANAGRRDDEPFEASIKRTLKLFKLDAAESEGEPEPKPKAKAAKEKLDERRAEWDENGGVAVPSYREADVSPRRKTLNGIAAVLARANERGSDE